MSKMDKSNINKLLLGQMVMGAIGILSLLLADFGGYSYRYVWGDVYLYEYYYLTRYYSLTSDLLSTILILIGVAGLLFAIYFTTKNYRTKGVMPPDYFRGNARKSILGGVFTTVLAIIGALLIFSGEDAFLGTGFYGAFFGGLITVITGWQIQRKIEEHALAAQPIPQPTTQPIIQPTTKPSFCTVCGAPAGDSNFCQKCGARLRTDITAGMRYCMHCGSQISKDAAYCPKCGLTPPSGVEVRKCQKCGEIIPTVAKFCSKCGAGQSI